MNPETARTAFGARPAIRVVAPIEGEALQIMGATALIKAGDLSAPFILEHPVPLGYRVPLHFHEDEDESFFVLDGEVTFEGEDGIAHVGKGGFVHCPRGARHGFRNETDVPARMLVVSSAGGGLGPMLREFHEVSNAGSSLTPDKLAAIAGKHRIHIVDNSSLNQGEIS